MIWKPKMEQEDHNMKKVCDVCGWEYDEAEGYPEGGIAPCGAGKDEFSDAD